jgi:steroid delta-isomerase-like uncharacterized protein
MEAASVASELMESFNKSDWDRFTALCSPDIVYEEKGSNRTSKGIDGILDVAKGWKAAFPNIQGRIWTSAGAGNIALLEITWTGSNEGPLETPAGTVPATGKAVEFDDAQVYTVENGLVTSMRNYGDFLTMLTQLGIIPGS